MQEIVEIGRATQDELRDDLRELFQGAIRLTLEMVLEEELKAMVGARRFERVGSRKDHRNGTYLRRLLTSLGQIEVAMPRSRDNGSPADVIGRYQRRSPELDEMMVEAYVSGVSQRKMGDVTEALMGERVGRSTVSRQNGSTRPWKGCAVRRSRGLTPICTWTPRSWTPAGPAKSRT